MKLTIKYAVPGALIEDTIELPNDVGEVVVALSESERNELHLFNLPKQGAEVDVIIEAPPDAVEKKPT